MGSKTILSSAVVIVIAVVLFPVIQTSVNDIIANNTDGTSGDVLLPTGVEAILNLFPLLYLGGVSFGIFAMFKFN